MASSDRKYDLVLFGATGYTGQYTAKYISSSLPTNLTWAIAGRSHEKLSRISEVLKSQNPDRKQPEIELAQLKTTDLDALASKTRVMINTVGPYSLYGETVVAACINNATHYLDVTGETPWIHEMISKYHSMAKANGVIIIPEIGTESAPSDMISFALAKYIRKKLSLPTKDVICSLHDVKGGVSGGTLATVLTLFTCYPLRHIASATSRGGLCPIRISSSRSSIDSLSFRLLGVRAVSNLGTLTTSFFGSSDVPIVYRSWGLLSETNSEESYGPNFHFNALMAVRNLFLGILAHVAIRTLPLVLMIPPFRWILGKLVYEPGQGPSEEDTRHDYIEYRALGVPDGDTRTKAFARLRWEGSAYHLTGALVAQGAATVLNNEAEIKRRVGGGGVVTPAAALGSAFVDRLENAGIAIELKSIDD